MFTLSKTTLSAVAVLCLLGDAGPARASGPGSYLWRPGADLVRHQSRLQWVEQRRAPHLL
jgi:hypothetical protein